MIHRGRPIASLFSVATRTPTHADTLPYWTDSASVPIFKKIEHDVDVEVVVVGAGITGLSAAYFLKRAGKKVCRPTFSGRFLSHRLCMTSC